MLNKNNKYFLVIVCLTFAFFCSGTQLKVFYNNKEYTRVIKEVALGYIEIRNLEADPYIIKNFYDTLRFELERNGYKVSSQNAMKDSMKDAKVESNVTLQDSEIYRLTTTSGFDLYIQGYLQESVTGDVLNQKIDSSIVLFLHGRDEGKRVGEIRLFARNEPIKSNLNLQNMVTSIVQALKKETPEKSKK